MRIVLALLLLGHGVAHLPGFLVAWRLRSFPELPYHTTVLGGTLDVGDGGMRVLGGAWALLAMLVALSAVGVLLRWEGVLAPLPWILAASLAICLLGWPEARLGVLANLVLLGMVLAAARMGWVGSSGG